MPLTLRAPGHRPSTERSTAFSEEPPTSIEDTYRIEVAKWDTLASAPRSDESLRLCDRDFESHARRARTMPGMAEFLGDLRGREVLECGCGGRRRNPPVRGGALRRVVGTAILHHLDVDLAGPQLYRVQRPGGRAAFSEPLGTNPLIVLARDHLPYPHKNPRGADNPLSQARVEAWGAPFRECHHREIRLLSMAERALGLRLIPALARADEWLLAHRPALRRYCRYVILTTVK
jgi:hypothetical protein